MFSRYTDLPPRVDVFWVQTYLLREMFSGYTDLPPRVDVSWVQTYLLGEMFSGYGGDARHEVLGEEGSDGDRVLAGRRVAHRVPVKVQRHQHHRHLTQLVHVTYITITTNQYYEKKSVVDT